MPVLALIEQQVRFDPQRDMLLLWGMRRSADFYAVDDLRKLLVQAPGLRVRLVAEHPEGAPQGGERPQRRGCAPDAAVTRADQGV